MKTTDLVARWRPGSADATGWGWPEERADLLSHVCLCCDQPGHYQLAMEEYLRRHGVITQPVCLGPDGRVWDGHHRIVAALHLGIEEIPVEPAVADER